MKTSERRKELHAKGQAELQKELMELLREQFNLRMQKSTQQLQNFAKLGQVRRDIARVRTLLGQKARQA